MVFLLIKLWYVYQKPCLPNNLINLYSHKVATLEHYYSHHKDYCQVFCHLFSLRLEKIPSCNWMRVNNKLTISLISQLSNANLCFNIISFGLIVNLYKVLMATTLSFWIDCYIHFGTIRTIKTTSQPLLYRMRGYAWNLVVNKGNAYLLC